MIVLSSTGYIQVHAYESRAQIPLSDVAVAVTATDGTAIAMRITDRSGRIEPIAVPVPDPAAGQTPDTGVVPFTRVNLYARLDGFEQIENEDLQVFPNTTTLQDLELVPIAELPDKWDRREIFITPAQNL